MQKELCIGVVENLCVTLSVCCPCMATRCIGFPALMLFICQAKWKNICYLAFSSCSLSFFFFLRPLKLGPIPHGTESKSGNQTEREKSAQKSLVHFDLAKNIVPTSGRNSIHYCCLETTGGSSLFYWRRIQNGRRRESYSSSSSTKIITTTLLLLLLTQNGLERINLERRKRNWAKRGPRKQGLMFELLFLFLFPNSIHDCHLSKGQRSQTKTIGPPLNGNRTTYVQHGRAFIVHRLIKLSSLESQARLLPLSNLLSFPSYWKLSKGWNSFLLSLSIYLFCAQEAIEVRNFGFFTSSRQNDKK